MPASLSAARTRALQLRAFQPDLSATLLDEFTYGLGPQSLRPVHAALETLHSIPSHHRDTPEADSPSGPEQWLRNWCTARQKGRLAERNAARARQQAA